MKIEPLGKFPDTFLGLLLQLHAYVAVELSFEFNRRAEEPLEVGHAEVLGVLEDASELLLLLLVAGGEELGCDRLGVGLDLVGLGVLVLGVLAEEVLDEALVESPFVEVRPLWGPLSEELVGEIKERGAGVSELE